MKGWTVTIFRKYNYLFLLVFKGDLIQMDID